MIQLKEHAEKIMNKSPLAAKLAADENYRRVFFAVWGLIFNLLYAFYNAAVGIASCSVWFGTSGIYYLMLAAIKFAAVAKRKNAAAEHRIKGLAGGMLLGMSLIIGLILYISLNQDTASKYGEITMITIATYTFTKITLAIIGGVKQRREYSAALSIIRNVRYAEVAVSVFTMQKSMLVSFGYIAPKKIFALNLGTGLAVCLLLPILGAQLLISKRRRREDG